MEYDLDYEENFKILVITDEMIADYFWGAYIDSYPTVEDYFEDKIENKYTVLDYYDAYFYDQNELLCRAYSREIEELDEKPFNYQSYDMVGEVAIDESSVLDANALLKEMEADYLKEFLLNDVKHYSDENISKFLLAIAIVHPEIIPEIEKAIIETNLDLSETEVKPNKRRL